MFTEKLIKLFTRYITEAQFVFRFMYYEKNTTINDTNVVQYEFINQGNTVIDINGMLLQPSASGLEPVRWISAIQNNENDVTVYKVKFQKVATKLCSGSVCITGFVPCPDVPPFCQYTIKIEIDGVSLGGGFIVQCNYSQAQIQALLDANLLPQYVGKILVTFGINGLCFQFTDIPVAVSNAGIVTIFFQAIDPTCPLFSPIVFPLTCTVFTPINKLLVISKMKASTRVLN